MSSAENRGAVYRLLARLWANELDQSVVELFSTTDTQQLWTELGGIDPSTVDMEETAEDYTRLLIGPLNHVSPVQSVWASGELQSETAVSVQEFAEVCQFTSPWESLPLDHLSNTLMIMARLVEVTAHVNVPDALQIPRVFFGRHVDWVQQVMQRLAAIDEEGFYGNAAQVTATFLKQEADEELKVAVG